MDIRIGRFAIRQLERGDAEGPDVGLVIVTGLLDDFRCHPERCSHESILLGHGR